MRFWDTSALLPLLVEEPTSAACRQLLRLDPSQAVSFLTHTEATSALWRRKREGLADLETTGRSEARLDMLAKRWSEVRDIDAVRAAAERALRVHALAAADALQLGAATVLFRHQVKGRDFVCLDDALILAAELEGFTVIRPR